MCGLGFLLCGCDFCEFLGGIVIADVGAGGTGSGGLDRVVPSVAFDQVSQCAAIAVVRVLCGIGDEGNPLFEEFVHRELGGLWPPAANGVAGFLGLGCVDAFPV